LAHSHLEKYVYIASAGHSGSTLLNLLLNLYPEVTTVGRVQSLKAYAKYPHRLCMCGRHVQECDFWRRVQAQLRQVQGNERLELADFPLMVARKTGKWTRLVPRAADPLLLLGSRRLWRGLSRFVPDVRAMRQAALNSLAVYEAVAKVNDTPIVVDASNNAARMKATYLTDAERFWLIHLVRDGRAVAHSQMQRDGISMRRAALIWAQKNRNLQYMAMTIPRRRIHIVRYEDLCAYVAETMAALCAFLEIPSSVSQFIVEKQDVHNISGNPMRFRKDEREIRLDDRWRAELTPDDLREFDRAAGRMNHRFGYV